MFCDTMKPALILFSLLGLHWSLTAQQPVKEPPARPPVIRTIPRLEDCPEAVRAAFQKHAPAARLTEIKQITAADKSVSYSFETGTEEDGVDAETAWHFDPQGALVKKEEDVPLKSAPSVIQQALLKLAGSHAVVDDVERVTEGKKITWKAELESNGGADRKVLLASDGTVLTLEEEDDD